MVATSEPTFCLNKMPITYIYIMTVQIRSDVKACIRINRVHLVKGQANVPMKMAKLKEVHGIIRVKEEPPFAKPYCKKTFQGINSGWYKYGRTESTNIGPQQQNRHWWLKRATNINLNNNY